ncbi:hypothetical protein HanPSC8_Chr06g0235691 [Helianthus annuus]|nr:hypothetical protein HanPSC8_Chr06g0235691 [Helianthus annuus]
MEDTSVVDDEASDPYPGSGRREHPDGWYRCLLIWQRNTSGP